MTSYEVPPPEETSGHPTRRHVIAGAAALGAGAVVAGGALAGCSSDDNKGGSGGGATDVRHQTLFIAGQQWATPTSFNPANPTAAWPYTIDQMNLNYESLFGFDVRDGSIKGNLAESIEQPDANTLVVKLRAGTKFQDGHDLTADDVVYTFEFAKRVKELQWNPFWLNVSSITATDPQTVTIALDPKSANPGITKTYLAQAWILPKHLWTTYEQQNAKIVDFTNMQPVGSGPYKVDSFNATQIKWVRDDNYWGKAWRGKLPAPKWIVHPIFKDNAAGDLALQQGQVDVSQQFTPEIWKMWQDKKLPIKTWFDKPPYHLPGSIPMLVINCTKIKDPKIRRALAFGIDYARIASTAMSQYSNPAQSSVVIPGGSEQQYFDADNVAKNGWKYDVAQAKQLLQEAGGLSGSFKVQTPTGWSDWQAAVNIVVENFKALGLNVTASFPQAPQVISSTQNGDFDFAVFYVAGATPAAPWQRFRDVLDSRGVPPKGQSAFYNYGRFSHPDVPGLLDKAATATGADAKALFTQLDTIFMQNAPMIPLMYRPLDFFEASESVWTGFPDSKNNDAAPMFRGAGIEWLYKISPKTK